ncbi:MAG: hypothetical protein U0559_00655 [Anaerolineae bacterium]
MAQELELKLRTLRAELTQLVREGLDEDGTVLRRMLAELERLENQRWSLRADTRPIG